MKPSMPFEKHHLEFLSDPEHAQTYLEVALEEYARDQNTSALLLGAEYQNLREKRTPNPDNRRTWPRTK